MSYRRIGGWEEDMQAEEDALDARAAAQQAAADAAIAAANARFPTSSGPAAPTASGPSSFATPAGSSISLLPLLVGAGIVYLLMRKR